MGQLDAEKFRGYNREKGSAICSVVMTHLLKAERKLIAALQLRNSRLISPASAEEHEENRRDIIALEAVVKALEEVRTDTVNELVKQFDGEDPNG